MVQRNVSKAGLNGNIILNYYSTHGKLIELFRWLFQREITDDPPQTKYFPLQSPRSLFIEFYRIYVDNYMGEFLKESLTPSIDLLLKKDIDVTSFRGSTIETTEEETETEEIEEKEKNEDIEDNKEEGRRDAYRSAHIMSAPLSIVFITRVFELIIRSLYFEKKSRVFFFSFSIDFYRLFLFLFLLGLLYCRDLHILNMLVLFFLKRKRVKRKKKRKREI